MNERDLICISCPIGCRLRVRVDGDEVTVTGNRCARGEAYGREEVLEPRRVVTCVVPTDSTRRPWAPVKSEAPVPKDLIPGLLRTLYRTRLALPVRLGDVVLDDFAGTGLRVVATRSLDE